LSQKEAVDSSCAVDLLRWKALFAKRVERMLRRACVVESQRETSANVSRAQGNSNSFHGDMLRVDIDFLSSNTLVLRYLSKEAACCGSEVPLLGTQLIGGENVLRAEDA